MSSFLKRITHFLAAEDGPTAVEYAMMVLLIFLACLTAINFFGQATATSYEASRGSLEAALGPPE